MFAHDPGVVTSENVNEIPPPQESVIMGGVKTGVAGQLIGVVCTAQSTSGGAVKIVGHGNTSRSTVSLTANDWPSLSVTVRVATY